MTAKIAIPTKKRKQAAGIGLAKLYIWQSHKENQPVKFIKGLLLQVIKMLIERYLLAYDNQWFKEHIKHLKFGLVALVILSSIAPSAWAQLGGEANFEFLNLPGNARQIALGGPNVSSYGNDVNAFLANPALLQDSTDRHLSLNFMTYFAGATFTNLAYSVNLGNTGMWGVGLQYLDYGQFDQYDPAGNPEGTFNASDFALVIGKSHQLGPFAVGANLKLVQSGIAGFQASGLMLDLAGAFIHPKKDLIVGMNIRNLGFALGQYIPGQSFTMPLDIQLGASFKPENMPFRLSVTAHHLHQFDIVYSDPNQQMQTDAFGNPIENEPSFADKLARHFVVGGEFVITKNFNLRTGYNFLLRRELGLEEIKGATGFSFGLMARVKKFEFAYSRSIQHLAGGTNVFTLTLNTRNLIRKKTVIE